MKVEFSSEYVEDPIAKDSHPNTLLDELASRQNHVKRLLQYHLEAAEIAHAIEQDNYWEFEDEEVDADSLRGLMLDAYFHRVPEGIAKRRARNDEIEAEIEEAEREVYLAFLGHTFTYDRDKFWSTLINPPEELRLSFIQFGAMHAPCSARVHFSRREFELFYDSDPREANAWQEEYSDEHDNDELMQLLALLRLC